MNTQSNVPVGREGEVFQYSLRDLLTVVFKRRSLIVLITITTLVVVMSMALRGPRTYEVTATLLVNKARAEVPMAPTDSRQLIINQVSEQDLNSEIEVLKNRNLIEDVVRAVDQDREPEVEESSGHGIRDWVRHKLGEKDLSAFDATVLRLQNSLAVTAVRKSNVIKVSLASTDPEWATQVVGTLIDHYLERRAERYRSTKAVAFFKGQMRAAEEQLAECEQALEDFIDEASITMVKGPQGTDSLAARKALMMDRLAKLESDLGDSETLFQQQAYQVSTLRAQLAEEPERLKSASRNNQDAAAEEIEVALASMYLQRDALLQDFKPDSRYVRDIDTQISMAEERLRQVQARTIGINRTESNPVYLGLKSELLRSEADLEGTRARVEALRAQAPGVRRTLDDLNAKAFQLDVLNRNARAAEENYLLYRKKHEEARISEAMDQEKFINVTIAQPAQVPLTPVPRQLGVKLFLSLLIGVLGGVGLAFGLENFVDRSFTTGEDIERKLGIPHIASIPESGLAG